MGILVLTIRFLCELGALVAVGWWGYHVPIALPVVVVVGGLFVAPRAVACLRDPWRFLVGIVVWAGATV